MQMDQTAAAEPSSSEATTEHMATEPRQDLSAHEVQVILQYRAASRETRENIRRVLAPHLSD